MEVTDGQIRHVIVEKQMGQRGFFGFDEILSARAKLSCPNSPDKYTTVTGDLDIEIIGAGIAGIGGISGGNDYDLYVPPALLENGTKAVAKEAFRTEFSTTTRSQLN